MAKKDHLKVMTRIVFHDGDKILLVEDMTVRSGTSWKQLQSTVAKRAGVSSHQIGLYTTSGDPDVAAADPVTHKLPSDAIFYDPDGCYLLAIIHRSPTRNPRRDKPTPERILLRRDFTGGGCYSPSSAQVAAMRLIDDKLMAQTYLAQGAASWHPDDVAMAQAYQAQAAMYASDDASMAQDQNGYLRYRSSMAQDRKEYLRYRSSMANSQQPISLLRSALYDSGRAMPNNENIVLCEVCKKTKRGVVPEFHLCKNERVLGPTEWRADFGPISKPRCGYLR